MGDKISKEFMSDGRVAAAGATGTAGSRIVDRLASRAHTVVPISRSAAVDLHTGEGLREALSAVEVVVDASNAFPADPAADLVDTLAGATRRLVEATQQQGVERVVAVSIANLENCRPHRGGMAASSNELAAGNRESRSRTPRGRVGAGASPVRRDVESEAWAMRGAAFPPDVVSATELSNSSSAD